MGKGVRGWAAEFIRDKIVDAVLERGLAILAPFVVSAGAFVWGCLDKWPGPVLIALASFVFFMVAAAVTMFDTLASRRSPRGKVVYGEAVSQLFLTTDNEVQGASFGFQIRNLADYPLEYQVEAVRTSIGGRVNEKPIHNNRGALLEPLSTMTFWDSMIPFDKTMLGKSLEGDLEMEISYGRPNRMKYRTTRGVRLVFYTNGPQQVSFSYFAR